MAKFKLNAVVPFATNPSFHAWLKKQATVDNCLALRKVAANLVVRDPTDVEWGTHGFVDGCIDAGHGGIAHDLDGAAILLIVQFNQRNLPAAVRNEKLDKDVADLKERQGRDLRKDEYAQLRDAAEAALLPQAFIKRTRVPVLVFKERILLCSSSMKLVDSAMILLAKLAECKKGLSLNWAPLRTVKSISSVLRECAMDGEIAPDEVDNDRIFTPMQAIKLRGRDKRSVAFKDRDLENKEVQAIVTNTDYSVAEMALAWGLCGDGKGHVPDPLVGFTLTDGGIYKGIKLAKGVMAEIDDAKDLHAATWLFAKTTQDMVADMTSTLGGLAVDDDEDEM